MKFLLPLSQLRGAKLLLCGYASAQRNQVVEGCLAEIRPIVPDTGNAETGIGHIL